MDPNRSAKNAETALEEQTTENTATGGEAPSEELREEVGEAAEHTVEAATSQDETVTDAAEASEATVAAEADPAKPALEPAQKITEEPATDAEADTVMEAVAATAATTTAAAIRTTTPTLDESLAQLEEAIDLFTSAQDEEATDNLAATAAAGAPSQPARPSLGHPEAATVAAPVKNDSFEQTVQDLKRVIAKPQSEALVPQPKREVLIVPPEEAEKELHRLPLVTEPQKKMLWAAALLLSFFALIGYLIWQRQKNDELRLAADQRAEMMLRARPTNAALTLPETTASPIAATLSGDQGLAENIKQILTAYNPTAATTRYKIDVKDCVVTLSGDVQSQLEKEGAENVIKPLTGIRKVVNNLQLKGFPPGPSGASTPNGPVMFPQVNPVEAKRLEEALKRDLAEGAKRADEERQRIENANAQIAAQRAADETAKLEAAKEAERLHRQQTAAVQNEEDAAFRKQAEDRQKQKEEAERRTEEQRKAEAAAPPKVEAPPPAEPSHIRTGTVAWRGLVKGVDDIVLRGTSTTIQHVMGEMPREAKGSFSTSMPDAPMSVRLVAASGPAPIRIIQQPAATNNFTTIVRVGEGNKAEGKPHSFTLRWAAQ